MRKLRTIALFGLAAAGVALGAISVQAAPIVVNSLTEFNTAIGGASTTTDPFDNEIDEAASIIFDSGVVSTVAGYTASADNGVDGATYVGNLNPPHTLTWEFPFPVIGFGADFQSINVLDATIVGTGIIFDINTGDPGDGFSGFFGIVDSMTPFTQVEFTATEFGDAFEVDDLVFAQAVPEPTTLTLATLALLGMCCHRRRPK